MRSNFSIDHIYLAGPRGFCAGVVRAVDTLDKVLEIHGAPVYARHAIVHNRTVVKRFEKKGAIFVEELEDIPNGSVVVFSAHGSPPNFYEVAKKKNLKVYDATCPLVLKVHLEARKYAKEGYFIFYLGHRGHPEPISVMGNVSPESFALIETVEEAKKIKPPQTEKLIVLTQTTLSFDDTKEVLNSLQEHFPTLIRPPAFDICYATQNRQLAVKELAKKSDVVIVLGSPESSNSVQLREVTKREGTKAYLVDNTSEVQESWFDGAKKIGITAGASAPEDLVLDMVTYLSNEKTKVQELIVKPENVHFQPPVGL